MSITTLDLQKSIEFNPINTTKMEKDQKASVHHLLEHIFARNPYTKSLQGMLTSSWFVEWKEKALNSMVIHFPHTVGFLNDRLSWELVLLNKHTKQIASDWNCL